MLDSLGNTTAITDTLHKFGINDVAKPIGAFDSLIRAIGDLGTMNFIVIGVITIIALIAGFFLVSLIKKPQSDTLSKLLTNLKDVHDYLSTSTLDSDEQLSIDTNAVKEIKKFYEKDTADSSADSGIDLSLLNTVNSFYKNRLEHLKSYARNPYAFNYKLFDGENEKDILEKHETKVKQLEQYLEKFDPEQMTDEAAAEQMRKEKEAVDNKIKGLVDNLIQNYKEPVGNATLDMEDKASKIQDTITNLQKIVEEEKKLESAYSTKTNLALILSVLGILAFVAHLVMKFAS